MKKFYLFFVFLFCSLVSCTDFIDTESNNEGSNITTDTVMEFSNPFISGIINITKASSVLSRDDEILNNLVNITGETGDTLLYVYNKPSGGWVIYSSDVRVPAIVGQSDTGSFNELIEEVPAARDWIESLMEDMIKIKSASDEELNFSKEDIEKNVTFWKSISDPNEFVLEYISELDNFENKPTSSDPIPYPGAEGHYELVSVTTEYRDFDSIGRLTTTDWSQGDPYNAYCPWRNDITTERAPAGCVAISGAQMLYFLHNKIGLPTTAPSYAYCNGKVGDSDYKWDQTNYSTNQWNLMTINGINAAPLIAYVGRMVNMKYGNTASTAVTADLVNKVFNPTLINCKYGPFDSDTLKNSLLDGMPVIARASATNGGHSFIIDKYRRNALVTVTVYKWVYNSSSAGNVLPNIPDKVEYTFMGPETHFIGMNWGWGAKYNNGEYIITGDRY